MDGGASTRLAVSAIDSMTAGFGAAVRSSDGRSRYVTKRLPLMTAMRGAVVEYRIADGSFRKVLRFDEPSRLHSSASNGIAEHDGWLCSTLSDFQSDVWVASVTGLSK